MIAPVYAFVEEVPVHVSPVEEEPVHVTPGYNPALYAHSSGNSKDDTQMSGVLAWTVIGICAFFVVLMIVCAVLFI